MSYGYDITSMDMGIEGWKIKVPAAKAVVRQKLSIPRETKIGISEIESGSGTVTIYYTTRTKIGFLRWKDDGGSTEVSVSEFNAVMNRVVS